jgi:uroporphyrinogen III methyltransferase/synthase
MNRSGLLTGVGVAVTRGEGPDGPLTVILKERGARVLDWGSVTFGPPEDLSPLLAAIARIWDYDWICFSSPRAVEAVVSRVPVPPKDIRMAAVGPSTSAALRDAGWPVDRIPPDGGGMGEGAGKAVVETFRQAGDARGARVFFPASALARDVIPVGLSELGAEVDRVTAYRLITLPVDGEACGLALAAGEVQVVTFASPSAMWAFQAGIGEDLFNEMARSLPCAAMGPTTAKSLTDVGWANMAVASTPTFHGLADAAEKAARIDFQTDHQQTD